MRANVDHIAVERRINGDTSVTLNDDETNALIVACKKRGDSDAVIGTILRFHPRAVWKRRREMELGVAV